jgi:hypothetical protein
MRTRNIVIASLSLCALTLGSFWLGFREGANIALLVDSAPRGSISLYQLQGLKRGVSQNMVIGLEGDMDVALLHTAWLESHPLYPLLEPVWDLPVASTRRSLVRLADYRKVNPSPLSAAALATEPPSADPLRATAVQELIQATRQNELLMAGVVQKYATPGVKP